jgi:protein KRI1
MKADAKKKVLFDNGDSSSSDDSSSSSSSEEVEKLTVNKKFAKAYESRKQKEELRQMQDRGEMLDSDDSSSEEEDEDAQLITPSVNLQFIKTIKALRNKDSSIYDPQTQFFEDDGNEDNKEKSEKKRKPKKFKDVIREQILEQMDDEDAEKGSNDNNGEDEKPSKFAYDEQQEELRKAFLKESKMASDSESDDDNDWMIVKKKGVAKVDDPETEKKVAEELKTLEESFKGRKEKEFKDPRGEVKDGDQFLIDYIKNKKWIDNSNEADDDSEDEEKAGDESDASSLGEMDKADDFEAKYNFRFEQAAAETATSGATFSVQSYARAQTMNTLRRKDETRRDKRLARKERKAAERKAKEEQLKRLKNAKKTEMNQKLSKVKSVLGEVGDDAVDEVAIMKMLEGDYDPEKFEEAMKAAYGDDFYQKDDTQWRSDKDVVETLKNDEDVVDVVGQDDLDGGLYDNYGEGEGDENNGEDEEYPDEEMEEDEDDDIIGGEQEEETDLQKKIKTKMQEELYKLDYEDVVAGMPTRFKYRQVEANDYGLSTEEILLARDTTLKQFVSLNKMAPYNEGGEYFTDSKKRRRFREALKAEIEEEQKKDEPVDEGEAAKVNETAEDTEPKKKKRRRIKKGKKNKDKENESDNPDNAEDRDGEEDQDIAPESEKIGDEAADEEGKTKRRKKKGKKGQSLDSIEFPENDAEEEEEKTTEKTAESTKAIEKKKKRKKKKNALAGLSASRLGAYGL